MTKMGWLLGWAVPTTWFASMAHETFPQADHVFFSAGPDALAQLRAAGSFDHVVGYSLGAHLLLAAAGRGETFARVSLLAPIFAFAREENLGGRIARTQVRQLARWIRNDPAAALADFYSRAGLDVSVQPEQMDDLENLRWGLERLERDRVEPKLPEGWRAWCGSDDALLDAARLAAVAPEVTIVPQATHHPRGLLHAMANELR